MTLEKIFTEKGWFPLTEKITTDMREKFEKYIAKCEAPKLILSTPGGDLGEALCIVDMLKLWKKVMGGTIYSFCIGECCSAGLTILSACDKAQRECSPHAKFLFHDHTIHFQAKYRLGLDENIMGLKKRWEWHENTIAQEIEGLALSKEKIMELRFAGEYHNYSLTPAEAKELGIIATICESPTAL